VIHSFRDKSTAALAAGLPVARFANIVTGWGSTAYASTTNIVSVSTGLRQAPMTLKSSTTTNRRRIKRLSPVTPGELLLHEFMIPMGLTKYRVAKEIGVPAQRIGEIVAGRRSITADSDLRLCRFFGLSNGYWLRAQIAHDTEIAEKQLAVQLRRIKPWVGSAA